MAVVHLGNTSVLIPTGGAQAVVHDADGPIPAPAESVAAPHLGQQVTTITLGVGGTIADVAAAWAAHSVDPPAWVESDDDVLARQAAEHFGCPVGCPDNGLDDVDNHTTWVEG